MDNFTDINSLQFSINYDPSVLQFQSFQNFAFGPVTTQNFNTSAPGQSRFIWSDPNADGESLPNGATLFQICFTITNTAETTIGITGIPIAIEASNVAGMQLPVVTNSGMINAGGMGGPNYDELSFVISAGSGGVGDQVCLDVQVFNFTAVNSVQFSINYPQAGLTFVQANNFAFGPVTTQNFNNSAPGVIRFIWADPNADGETLADGAVFFTLCFTINNTNPNSVSITSNPIVIEASDVAGNQLPVDVFSGTVNGTGSPTFTATLKNPTCNGDNNGSIALNVNSASSVSYAWSGNVSSGPTANNLSAGTYGVTVTNNNTGQQTSESYTLTNPPVFIVSNPMVTGITCNGSANGSITLTASGGVTPYVIDWSSPLTDGQLTQTNLGPGSYSVTITDANGCQRNFPNIGVSQPNPINITGGVVNIGANPGMINVTVTGGTPSYTYLWSGPAGYSNTTQDLGGLSQPGTYCVTVTDSRGCTRQQCFAVERDLRVEFDITPPCAGQGNGAIDLTVTGGDGNYNYTWTNAAATVISVQQDVSGLPAGMYRVVVSDGDGNSVTLDITLPESTPINLNFTLTSSTTGTNGAIDISVSGGVSGYTYAWSTGATTQDISGLAVGNYCVTVTDALGCTANQCFDVSAQALSIVSLSVNPTICNDSNDGSATITIGGGVPPYTVTSVPSGFTATSMSSVLNITNLPAGIYTFNVTDGQGSPTASVMATINAAPAITVASTSVINDTEDSACTGSITISLSGGTSPYTVNWNVMTSGTMLTGLCAGNYSATVTDANGCQVSTADIAVGMLSESAITTNVECPSDASGTITQIVSGGTAPYSYVWRRQGFAEVLATTKDISGLTTGAYVVVITDATGASVSRTHTVQANIGFSISASARTPFNNFGVSCQGAADGTLESQVSGQGTYTYEWVLNGNVVGNAAILSNAAAGSYTLNVTSEAGCIQSRTLSLTAPAPLTLNEEITGVSCEGELNGAISTQAIGGVSPYSYTWSDGRTSPRISFLAAGEYMIEVSDANGCFVQEVFSVNEPDQLLVTATATDATEDNNGSISLITIGGNPPYTYRWTNVTGVNGPVAGGLDPGEYSVEVFDANGCQSQIVTATVRDRRFPCLSERRVITPNGDGLNEAFILFCADGPELSDNTIEIFNRWGQLVYSAQGYDCSEGGGLNCFIGRTNEGTELPAGPYYYVIDYANMLGERQQKRGSLTIVRE